jgi:hypothetical protein
VNKIEKERRRFKAMPFWRRAERVIAQRLRLEGIPCELIAARNLGWDIEAHNGLKIECKAARLLRRRRKGNRIRAPFWSIGIARSRRLRERGVNFYVIRLLGHTDFRSVYLVLRAPIRKKMLQITIRQLLTKHRGDVNRFDLIREAEC